MQVCEANSTVLLSPLKKNIAANFVGSIWQALMGLAFIPLYIKFMGIESYGLIGIFATLQIIFGLLDLGLGSTLTREMARLSALPHKAQEMRNLVRTLETLYWIVAVFVGIIIIILSSFISHYWIKAGQLSPQTIQQAILIMGLVMIFHMPIGFYSGGFIGLQKQVLLNVINVFMSTLRGAGAILILWLVSPTIQAFLLWQTGISIINTFLLALLLWRELPYSGSRAIFQKQLIKKVWRFAAGMSGISILAVILTQLDKVILSKILSLEMFGYYMLASMAAMSLSRLFTPVFSSIYPRLTQLVSINDQEGLKQLYHKSCQLIAVLILPAAIVIAFFSYEVILLWTQNPATAETTHFILSIMICGTAINGLMHPPYALQLAFGWTKLSLLKTFISVILLGPFIIYMTKQYGITGAAVPWLILNIGLFFIEIPIMHFRLLRKEMWPWYWQDVGVPLIACLCIAGLGRLFFVSTTSQLMMLQYLIILSVVTFGIAAITVPLTRSRLLNQMLKKDN